MRLIDADILIKTIKEQGIRGSGWSDSERESDVIDMIDSISTVDMDSAKYGHWEPIMKNGNQYGGYKCSACGKKVSIRGSYTYNFCPYCGVKVRSTALFPPEDIMNRGDNN